MGLTAPDDPTPDGATMDMPPPADATETTRDTANETAHVTPDVPAAPEVQAPPEIQAPLDVIEHAVATPEAETPQHATPQPWEIPGEMEALSAPEPQADAAPATPEPSPTPAPWEMPEAAADEPTNPWQHMMTQPDMMMPPAVPADDPTLVNPFAPADNTTTEPAATTQPATQALQPWEMPPAPADTAPTQPAAQAPQPWEMPASAPADTAPAQPAAQAPQPWEMPAATPNLSDIRAQAMQAWSSQSQQESELAPTAPMQPRRASQVIHYIKVASPALGGLVLLAIMYALWTWLNVDAPAPKPANAETHKAPIVKPVNETNDDVDDETDDDGTDNGDDPLFADVDIPDDWLSGKTITFETEDDPAPQAPKAITPTVVAPKRPMILRAPPSDLRLDSIAQLSKGPAATINGRTLYVGDEINGATIISIGKFTVDMELNGERFLLGFTFEEPPEPPPVETPVKETPTPTTGPATTEE
ncbi:MAG: hypothetical protein FWE88_00105 [Phycisphaerae bacterium]|nr:hypothetical protein [Phycisphaerae bacterium]